MSAEAECAEVIVAGRVQGVGYRQFARRAAEAQGVAGFVRNRSDGRVEARLVGAAGAIEAVLAELRRGPPGGRVERLEVVARGRTGPERGFAIAVTI